MSVITHGIVSSDLSASRCSTLVRNTVVRATFKVNEQNPGFWVA